MSKQIIPLPDEIRTAIAQMDTLANQILEYLYDEAELLSDYPEDTLDNLELELNSLQNNINDIQEEQGWI